MHGWVEAGDAGRRIPAGALIAAGVAAVLMLAASAGWLPEIGAAQRAAQERMIETENAAVCARLGLGDAAPSHAACLQELHALRAQDRETAEPFL